MRRALVSIMLMVLVSACSAAGERLAAVPAAPRAASVDAPRIAAPRTRKGPASRIVAARRPLQCAPYARTVSHIPIRGDAWTWWRQAAGRFARSRRPDAGAVLVLRRTRRLRYGHVAVVRRVLGAREIVVDHANWLNRGRIHLNTRVRDVSAKNDWSAIRVWYTPGDRLGTRVYPAYGFVHPNVRKAELQSGG